MGKIQIVVTFSRSLLARDAVCPRCKAPESRRSARRGHWERILGLVALPYRCSSCYLRFFRPRWPRPPSFRPSSDFGRTRPSNVIEKAPSLGPPEHASAEEALTR